VEDNQMSSRADNGVKCLRLSPSIGFKGEQGGAA